MDFYTPDWVRDAVFYQIFPDRFASSAAISKPNNLEPWDTLPTNYGFKGGDLLGIVERLDYLQALGITAIYMTPIFQSASNHRYHTHDYLQVDPILGGTPALRTLLDAAHARGMKVVLDGVFNHASRGFFQFNHILECGPHSPYLDWFTVNGFPLHAYEGGKHQYEAWFNLPALPKFRVENPQVRQFLLNVARTWIDFGIDGWRLDVGGEIKDDTFWQEFRQIVRAGNPEAYIVGEEWGDSSHWLQGDMWDAVMNYLFTRAVMAFFIRRHDLVLTEGLPFAPIPHFDAAAFHQAIEHLLALYLPAVTAVQLNLLDSHDTARFLSIAHADETALRLATLFQMTYPGAPSIYYGDEIGLEGHRDPDSRRAFPWEPERWNQDLLAYFKQVIALRHAYPALRRGSYEGIYAQGHVYAFARTLPDERLVIALNVGDQAATVRLPLVGRELTALLVPAKLPIGADSAEIVLPPRSGEVFLLGEAQ